MTPIGRWFRRFAEGYLERTYEGPSAPERIRMQVTTFAEAFPLATRKEWADFATMFARECYRSGFDRAQHWQEVVDATDEKLSPDELADMLDPGWREWSPPVDLSNPDALVPDVLDEKAALRSEMGANGHAK